MQVSNNKIEDETTLHEDLPFVNEQDVAAGDSETAAYTITGPKDYVVAIDAGTNVAPEFRDANGDKLDESTRISIIKCDKQGNRLAGGRIYSDTLGRFDYAKMRTDPDFFRKTSQGVMIAPREIVKIYVEVPEGKPGFDAGLSTLQIGDDTSDFGVPVEIVEMGNLSEQERQAVESASQVS